jgi:hypothetical protein
MTPLTVKEMKELLDTYPDDYVVLVNNGLSPDLSVFTGQHMAGEWNPKNNEDEPRAKTDAEVLADVDAALVAAGFEVSSPEKPAEEDNSFVLNGSFDELFGSPDEEVKPYVENSVMLWSVPE